MSTSISIEPGRAELLVDERGPYGVGMSYPRYDGTLTQALVIYRPDKLDAQPSSARFILQPIPKLGWLGRPWRCFEEGRIADELFSAMLRRDGFERHGSRKQWWSDNPATRANNRRRFHARKRQALWISNTLIRQALQSAPPDILRLARRFPLKTRGAIYFVIARSPRMAQLMETFPLLGYSIIARQCLDQAAEALRMVEAGAKLNAVAGVMEIPLALRKFKPGAVFHNPTLLAALRSLDEHSLHHLVPDATQAQRRWLQAIDRANNPGGPYIDWVARNAHLIGATTRAAIDAQVADIGDWVRACYARQVQELPQHVLCAAGINRFDRLKDCRLLTRPFSRDMSIATVRELSGAWHEAVVLSDPATNKPLPPSWRGPAKAGDMEILPLDSAVEIAAEGRAMHHCAQSLIGKVARGESYLYSARNGSRLATIEVAHSNGQVWIEQMRGPCNALLPKELQAKLTRWVRERDKWMLPETKESPAITSGGLIDLEDEIPF